MDEYAVLSFVTARVPVPDALSPAETEVARAVLLGQTAAQIALARGVSPRTIANQIASVYRKLGVASRAELAALCAVPPISGRPRGQTR